VSDIGGPLYSNKTGMLYCLKARAADEVTLSDDLTAVEIVAASAVGRRYEVPPGDDCVVPVAIQSTWLDRISDPLTYPSKTVPAKLTVGDVVTSLTIPVDRFTYLWLQQGEQAVGSRLTSERDLIVGTPISRRVLPSPQLVLLVFVDGLSGLLLAREGVEHSLPGVAEFFASGACTLSGTSSAEWSLPSLAGIMTGQHTLTHGLFHPKAPQRLPAEEPLLSEVFQRHGFFTFQVCGNWRRNPSYGYARGFDRTIYRRSMPAGEVTNEFIETVAAVKGRNIFAWTSFFDLHHDLRGDGSFALGLSRTALHLESTLRQKSVRLGYDESKSAAFAARVRMLDQKLSGFLQQVSDIFGEAASVVLFSDHGQSFLDRDDHILSEGRVRVPLFLRGRRVPQGLLPELVSNLDIFPTALALGGLDAAEYHGPGINLLSHAEGVYRDAVLSESVFPGAPYACVLHTREDRYVFSSGDSVSNTGLFSVDSIRPRDAGTAGEVRAQEVVAHVTSSRVFQQKRPG
jgi:hypothetical protein